MTESWTRKFVLIFTKSRENDKNIVIEKGKKAVTKTANPADDCCEYAHIS